MAKRGVIFSAFRVIEEATEWIIATGDNFTNEKVAEMLPGQDCVEMRLRPGGALLPVWAGVPWPKILTLLNSGSKDSRYKFAVWYKNRDSELKLWKADMTFALRNRRNKVRNTQKTGVGKSVAFPRKVGRPRPFKL